MRAHAAAVRLLFALLALLASVAGAAPSLRVSDASGAPGAEVTMTVTASDAVGIEAFRLVITYDPDDLAFVANSLAQSGTLTAGFLAVANEPEPGRLIIAGVSTTPVSAFGGDFLRFRLRAGAAASGAYSVALSSESTINGGAVAATFDAGTLTVQAAALASLTMPTTLVVDPGEAIDVPVELTTPPGQDLSGFRVAVNVDPGAFTIEAVETAGSIAAAMNPQVNDSTPGRVVVTGATGVPIASPSGTLLRVRLRAAPGALGSYAIAFDRTLTELNAGTLGRTLADGAVRVRGSVRVLSLPTFTESLPGEEATLAVSLDNAADLTGFRIALRWEEGALEFVGIDRAGAIAEDFEVPDPVATAGGVTIAGARADALTSGSSELLRVRVRVNGSATGAIPVAFDPSLTELDGGNLAVVLEGGTVTFGTRTLSLSAPAQAAPGEEFALSVPITSQAGVDGFRVAIAFDPGRMSYVPGSAASPLFPSIAVNATDASTVVVTGASGTPLAGGQGTLLTLRMRMAEVASGSTALAFDAALTELNAGVLPVTLVGTSISAPPRALSLPDLAVAAGAEVTVPVRIAPGTGVTGFRAVVTFDEAAFDYVQDSAAAGALAPDAAVVAVASPGRITVTGADDAAFGPGSGDIATFRLRADPLAAGTFALGWDALLTELNGGDIASTRTAGSITVGDRVLSIAENIPAGGDGTVTVPVTVSNAGGVNGFRIAVEFDSAALAFDSTFAPTGPPGFEVIANSSTPGRLVLVGARPAELPVGAATLVTFRLRATGAAGGTVPLVLEESLTELNAGALPVALDSGSALLPPAILVSPQPLVVREGGQAMLAVRLSHPPAGQAIVSLSRIGGDADIAVGGGTFFVFDAATFSEPQLALFTAAQDPDNQDGEATYRLSAPGLVPLTVSLRESDDEPRGASLEVW